MIRIDHYHGFSMFETCIYDGKRHGSIADPSSRSLNDRKGVGAGA
jgi:hypothetical protein